MLNNELPIFEEMLIRKNKFAEHLKDSQFFRHNALTLQLTPGDLESKELTDELIEKLISRNVERIIKEDLKNYFQNYVL